MIHTQRSRRGALVLVALLSLVLALLLAGCGDKSKTLTKSGDGTLTALDNLSAAKSALSTMAPDARLLLVQTAQSTTPTGTPVWAYLFGSPSTDKTFVVYASNGQAMGAQEYGVAGISEDDWKAVPQTDSWDVDSDEAVTKALEASGASGDPVAYFMGMLVHKSKDDTSTIKALVWQVSFDPGQSGATTGTIEVDAKTGSTSVAEPE